MKQIAVHLQWVSVYVVTLSMLDCPCMVHRRPPIMVIRKLTSYIFECNSLTILSLDFSFHIAELCFHTCTPNIAI